MTNHEHDEEMESYFELSQEELRSLMASLGGALILRGEISENPGAYDPGTDEVAGRFVCTLPAGLVRELFYKDDDDIIVKSGSYVSFNPRYYLEGHKDEAPEETVYLTYRAQLINTAIEIVHSIELTKAEEKVTAIVDTQYEENGKRISPTNFSRRVDEMVQQGASFDDISLLLVGDYQALERPLTLDEAEKLRQIETFILTT